MSTHNICFHGEIRKTLCGYPLLTVAMNLHNSYTVFTLSFLTVKPAQTLQTDPMSLIRFYSVCQSSGNFRYINPQ